MLKYDPFIKAVNGATSYTASGATFELTGKSYDLALNQTYHTLMEDNSLPLREKKYRGSIVKETTLTEYKKNEHAGNEDREKIKEELGTKSEREDCIFLLAIF